MKMTAVQSSQINAIGYEPATKTMRIEFKPGSLYEYSNVSPEDFEAFAKAPSIGSHFYKHFKPFKDKYPYVKLENNQAVDAPPPDMAAVVITEADVATAKASAPTTDAVHRPPEPEPIPDPVPPPPHD